MDLIEFNSRQVGKSWQPFGEVETFVKRVIAIFVTNASFLRVIANLHISTQYNMQYIPYISALFAQETLFLTQKGTFFAQRFKKNVNRNKS